MERTVREQDLALSGSARTHARRERSLVLALEGWAPESGGGRFDLGGVKEIAFGRGPERRATLEGTVLRVSLADPQISTKHARIVFEGDTIVLEDLASTNGTFVRGQRTARAQLADGDWFVLGSAAFFVAAPCSTPDAPGQVTWGRDLAGRKEGLASLSPTHAEALDALGRIAQSDLSVLLRGESGTGKEVLARAIHVLSTRSQGPFVAVNCAALPASLLEAQLFGHVKGAFSGAIKDEPGFFRAADGGTLFLDEIGDMPAPAQAALLRALETREVIPVGSTKAVAFDARVVSATLKPESSLRPDLVARLAGYRHALPPLRERMHDLGILVLEHLARQNAADAKFAPDAVRELVARVFPLNIRELGTTLRSAIVLAEAGKDGHILAARHLPPPGAAPISNDEAFASERGVASSAAKVQRAPVPDDARKASLLENLAATSGNISETARRMNTTRVQVHRWIQKFSVDVTTFKSGDGS